MIDHFKLTVIFHIVAMIDGCSNKRSTSSNTLASTKVNSFPLVASSKLMEAQPELLDNAMRSSRILKPKPSADKTSSDDVPPRRRAPPKSTKSIDWNEFTRQLGYDKPDAGSENRGAASNTHAPGKLHIISPAASLVGSSTSNKRVTPKRSKSLDENIFKSKFLPYTIPYLAKKRDKDQSANNALKIMTMVDTGLQAESFEYSGENAKTFKAASDGLPGSEAVQPHFRAKERVTSVAKIADGSDKGVTAFDAPTSAKVKSSPPAVLSKFIKKEQKSSAITMTWSRSVQAEPSMGNNSLNGLPRKRRAPPKSTKSLDGNEFRNQLDHNTPVSANVKGSSIQASSKFMQAQPETFDNTITWSRNMQIEPFAANISPDGPSRRRVPPKPTKSLDRNEFRRQLGHNRGASSINANIDDGSDKRGTGSTTPASAKVKGSPPAALSHLQLSFGDSLPGSTHHKRSESLGDNLFKSKFLRDTIPYLATKICNNEPITLFTALTMADTGPQPKSSEPSCDKPEGAKAASGGLQGSQNTQPESQVNKRVTRANEIDDSSDQGGTSSDASASTKVKGLPPAALSKFIKKERKLSSLTMTWSRSAKAEPSTGNTSLDGVPWRRRVPPKSTKSLDGTVFRNQLGHNRVACFDKIDNSSEKESTASNIPVSSKLKGFSQEALSKPMKVQPESPDNTITWSRTLQLDSSIGKTSRDAPPDAPLKSAQSLRGNELKSQLGNTRALSRDMIGNGSHKSSTASITLASAKLKSSLSTVSSELTQTQTQPELFESTITWSRSLQAKPLTRRTSRRRALPKSSTRRKRIDLPARSPMDVL
jgi:hypothetical protein